MTSVPLATMGRVVGRGNNHNGDGIDDYRRDRHGIPINAVPVSQPHLAPANALQYAQFTRVPTAGIPGDHGAPLLYRVVPGHENESSLQPFPGSQLFGQSNTPTTTSSPNNHEGMTDRFPFQYAAAANTSNDSNGQRTLVRPGGQYTPAAPVAAAPAANGKSNDATAVSARSSRDERRRATHNEVERRRRDKINNWIVTLSKIVPDCVIEASNAKGNLTQTLNAQSKGGVLAKTVEYISELKMVNSRMAEQLKENENVNMDVEILRQQLDELKSENAVLRNTLVQHGINMESS